MTAIHILAAILATWRLTEVITQDQIFARVRQRFPIYLWTCPRCVSVWMGALCVSLFVYFPLGNWPFALSWLLILHNQIGMLAQSKIGRRIIVTVHPNNQITVHNDGILGEEVPKILGHLLSSYKPAPVETFPKSVSKNA